MRVPWTGRKNWNAHYSLRPQLFKGSLIWIWPLIAYKIDVLNLLEWIWLASYTLLGTCWTLKQRRHLFIPIHLLQKSFQRKEPFDWTEYTHLVIKCRGDGRPYQLVLHMDRYFDVMWNDTYQFALYTRGGPYWQIAKVSSLHFISHWDWRGYLYACQGSLVCIACVVHASGHISIMSYILQFTSYTHIHVYRLWSRRFFVFLFFLPLDTILQVLPSQQRPHSGQAGAYWIGQGPLNGHYYCRQC